MVKRSNPEEPSSLPPSSQYISPLNKDLELNNILQSFFFWVEPKNVIPQPYIIDLSHRKEVAEATIDHVRIVLSNTENCSEIGFIHLQCNSPFDVLILQYIDLWSGFYKEGNKKCKYIVILYLKSVSLILLCLTNC